MIVLDTNVLSEVMRPSPTPEVEHWMAAQHRAELFTTAITEAEVFYGIEKLPAGKKRDRILEAALAIFEVELEGKILSFDSRAARMFARIAVQRRAMGIPISEADAQIAAIALSHGAQLATRDVSGFKSCGIALVNPWND